MKAPLTANSEPVGSEIIPIENRIFTLRGQQVLLDRDLAALYGVETKVLNQAVKRNSERFPERFMFQITKEEYDECKMLLKNPSMNLKSQIVTSSLHGGDRKLPYACTEQGVAMLSSVLKSETAIRMSILIMDAFVAMRQLLSINAQLYQRMATMEEKQQRTDLKVSEILTKLENSREGPKQGVFFQGQIFDAYQFVSDLVRSAKTSIILIDNYVNDSVLTLLDKRAENVTATVGVNKISPGLQLDLKRHNEQYPPIEVREISAVHDRFLLLDNERLYTFGASFKDLEKKLFCFSLLESGEVIRLIGELLRC
ncbi:MAG: ORF6N domain-containing protein [Bacteroidales bacterium]|nr:ORF6N domain-containing protein [Bacteroidales bacterium]